MTPRLRQSGNGMAQTKSVLIAMSGGVDSSVAALLLQAEGCRCQGATMRLYRNADIGLSQYRTCCSQRDIDDAADVAFALDIPYEVLDFTADFKAEIIDRFLRGYEAGLTPNPCIDCNRYMKFDKLLLAAQREGFSHIATGHYARIAYDDAAGRYLLKRAADDAKDQSYVLYAMTQAQLARTLFPLGELTKTRVREIAAEHGLLNARKHDSQDICFVPGGDYGSFLERYTGKTYPPGDFLDTQGAVVGRHRGAVRYTLGQRRGLGLSLGAPVYVCGKSMRDNTVTVGENDSLFAGGLAAVQANWISVPALEGPMRVQAKIRYRQPAQSATAYPAGADGFTLRFDEPQRAVTPGQAVVLYDGELVVGGGTIQEAIGHAAGGVR